MGKILEIFRFSINLDIDNSFTAEMKLNLLNDVLCPSGAKEHLYKM